MSTVIEIKKPASSSTNNKFVVPDFKRGQKAWIVMFLGGMAFLTVLMVVLAMNAP